MKHLLKLFLFTLLLTSYSHVNANITYCDVLVASDDGSKTVEGDKTTTEAEEEEEPDCD